MVLIVDESKVNAEREAYEHLAEGLKKHLKRSMKPGVYYTPSGLYDLANKFLGKKGIKLSTRDIDLLLVHSDSILEHTVTLKGSYTRLRNHA